MPGDFSRKTFDSKKHYSGALMQQGRVQLDADWNEQLDIQQHRTKTEAKDVIGASGVPKMDAGFKIGITSDRIDLTISPGRIYVGGLLCEIETPTTYITQPYYPNPDTTFIKKPKASSHGGSVYLNLEDGVYLVYLDVWQREINFIDDPLIHEVALGGPDTTTRIQNVWQVKLLPVSTGVEITASPPGVEVTCKTSFAEWNEYTAASTGMLKAKTKKPENQKEPCLLPSSSGYRRLENQLYRVEVHTGGTRDDATFKWSRDNASVETKIEKIVGSIITVSDLGKDEALGFRGGQWVEILDEESTLKGTPNPLVQIDKVYPAKREITLKTSADTYNSRKNLKLKRWDHTGTTATTVGVEMTADWVDLEGGIEVIFSDGSFRSGDYWLIPARTATGEIEWPPYEIPNSNPVSQPPAGIHHHYCRLALLEITGGNATLKDCRDQFPTLTEICAEDVCFDNDKCEFPDAETVQDALDSLCSESDLRHHNKYLHGHGVVCGLKVKCGSTRTEVVIEKGYALDCEGCGIHVKNEITLDVVTEANGLLDNNGGPVCLTIAGSTSEGAKVSVEPYVQQDFLDSVLEGTLLNDFYEGCIESLIIFLAQQFPTSFTDTLPVPETQKRLTALINLLAQLINSASGPYAFLSSDEDAFLRNFYDDLMAFIASETHCAMFDNDRPFPPYDIDPGLNTIFGPTFRVHHRLRLHPSRNLAYTCGQDNKIYVYDLGNGELIQTLEFPASTNLQIQDVAINESEIYAVGILNDEDSVFATATISADGTHSWKPTSVQNDTKYMRLAIGLDNQLYAIRKAHGLFTIDGIGLPEFSSTLVLEFYATGLLEISGSQAFAAEYSDPSVDPESSSFDRIIEIDTATSTLTKTYDVQGDDFENDIVYYNDIIYVTGDPPPESADTKSLYGFNSSAGSEAFTPVDLLDDTFTRLAVAPATNAGDFLLVTLADKFKVVRVDLDTHTLDSNFRIPVQIFPSDIAVSTDGSMGYVLNPIVNTLTAIDIDVVFDPESLPNFTLEPPTVVGSYRQGVIDAFTDLASHFLQYLKDCFCDKFLVDCPVCGQEDKVYLGCVEIRDGQVYNICNFTKRRYVKSFRTWGYWLSTIPILPMIKKSFAKFCCSVVDP